MKKLFTNLTFWVLTAILAGALLGHFAPEWGVRMEPLGKQFINVVKLFIAPLIFLTITLGISGMGDLKKVGRVGAKALIYFEVVTTFALIVGIVVAYLIQPGRGVVAEADGGKIGKYTEAAADFSWWQFFWDNVTLRVLEKLEVMGCSKSVVGLVVPAGYSFNLDGTTIYLSMATIFLAQVYGVELSWTQMLTIIGILMVTSKGAAGVTGSGFVVLASTLSAVQVIPVEGLALLLGVDRFMSEARAITNFIGNGVATVFLANNEREFDRAKMEIAFSTEVYEYDFHSDRQAGAGEAERMVG